MREIPFMLFYRSASEVSAIQYRDCFPSILPTLEIELSAYHLTTSFFSNKLRNFLFVLFYENRERIRDSRYVLQGCFKPIVRFVCFEKVSSA